MQFGENIQLELGPLEPLLQDKDVLEIMVVRYDLIYVERRGKLEETDARFDSEAHLLEIVRRIAEPLGRVVDASHPIVDLLLPDNSRVNIVIYPIAVNGTTVTIRKFPENQPTWEALVGFGSLTQEMVDFLHACVKANLNIVVSGGTGSGKTTIFNRMAEFIPPEERVILVEHMPEMIIHRKHLVRLEARPANLEGKGEITVRDLVINSLKMRPERILITEVHGAEILDMLQAMNTGHDGSMFTMHANSPRDVLSRMEVMATMGGIDIPILTIREQLASALDVIVNQQRLQDGSRRIMSVSEVIGMKSGEIELQPIFEFEQTEVIDGRIQGRFVTTGHVPQFLNRLREQGYGQDEAFFKGQ